MFKSSLPESVLQNCITQGPKSYQTQSRRCDCVFLKSSFYVSVSPHFKWFTVRNALWPLLSCMHFNLQNNSNRANLWSQPHTATSALFTLLLSADIAFVVFISKTGMIITKIYVCLFWGGFRELIGICFTSYF